MWRVVAQALQLGMVLGRDEGPELLAVASANGAESAVIRAVVQHYPGAAAVVHRQRPGMRHIAVDGGAHVLGGGRIPRHRHQVLVADILAEREVDDGGLILRR